ncbi:MAG: S-layer homology domain-containing protein [Mesotoga sp.]|uniref:S-layer homology domain-containing protein n=2 Tax=Mesotoga sp. TaxID=2053577 RepID=UPI002622F96D|nr:S-layer homology domain-containing protein [Mesotoga sp.]MDD3681136.1 S-layer homology domain-containing protein [Mesotoga sp.]MDI9367431.1 S-layer homology domain-containing protein [Thermotogota bacterium]
MKLLLASLLILGLAFTSAVAAVNYVDVSSNHWAYDAVMKLSDLGILTGIVQADGRTYFNGNDPLTRYQTAVMLKKTLDYVELNFAMQGTVPQVGAVDGTVMSRLEALELALTDSTGRLIDTMDLQLRITALENRIASLGISTNGSVSQSTVESLRQQIMKFVEDLSLTTKKLDTLAGDVQNVQNNMSSLSVMESRVNDAVRRVDTLSGNISTIQSSLSSNERAISTLDSTVRSLSNSLSDYDAKLSTITNRASTNAMEIASIRESMTTISGDVLSVRDLQNKIASLESQIQNMKLPAEATSKLDELSARVNTITSDYAKIGDLQNYVTKTDLKANLNLYAGIDELAKVKSSNELLIKDIETLRKDFSSETGIIKGDIGNLQRSINAINEIVTIHENELASVKSSVSTVSSLRSDLTALNSKFNALTDQQAKDFTANQASLADLEARMNESMDMLNASVEASLSKISLGMDTVNTQLGKNESEIKALKTRTDSLESRLNTTVVNLERYLKISDLETQPVIVNLSDRVAEINSATIDAATKQDVEALQKKTSPWLILSTVSSLAALGISIWVLIASGII